MKKAELTWSIALILLLVIGLPAASAQAQGGSSIKFVLVNAAIIGIVLFVLQSFLIPEKSGDKERTVIWFIILAVSLLIAWFYGRNAYIWQGPLGVIFNLHVIVNSTVISIVLYFVLELLGVRKKLESDGGKRGYYILILIMSVVFSVNFVPDKFIWQADNMKVLFAYLFSGELYTGPGAREGLVKGILHPKGGLIDFVVGFILLSFFFNNWLLKDMKDTSKYLNYALALLFAVQLANPPANPVKDLVQIGEVIFLLVFSQSLKSTFGDGKGKVFWQWFMAFLLVGWASAALTANAAEHRGFLGSVICKTSLIDCKSLGEVAADGESGGIGGAFKSIGMWGLIIIGGLIAIGFSLSKTEGEGKKWGGIPIVLAIGIVLFLLLGGGGIIGVILSPFVIIIILILFLIFKGEDGNRALKLATNEVKKRLMTLLPDWEILRNPPKDREPEVIRENKHLFHALANFTTRSEITYRYWDMIQKGYVLAKKLNEELDPWHDAKKLREEIIAYRSGGKITGEGGETDVRGWNKMNLEAINLLNQLYELVDMIYIGTLFRLKPEQGFHLEAGQLVAINTMASQLIHNITTQYNEYKIRTNVYGHHHVFRAYRNIILDMSNPTGEVEAHPFKFAKPGAEFDMGDQDPNVKSRTAKADANGVGEEVNQYGEVIADITEQKRKDPLGRLPSLKEYKRPRRVKNPAEIIDYPNFADFMKFMDDDWRGLAEDIRFGLHHPKSRTFMDYVNAFVNYKIFPEWADEKIEFTGSPTRRAAALDLRAIANPGQHNYWGRLRYHDETEGIPKNNPYPSLSSVGLGKYLKLRVEQELKDHHEIEEWLYKFPADSEVPKKDLDKGWFMGRHLSEKESKEQ